MLVAASGAFLGAVRGAFRHARDAAHAALPLEAARHAARLAAKLRVPELRDALADFVVESASFEEVDGAGAAAEGGRQTAPLPPSVGNTQISSSSAPSSSGVSGVPNRARARRRSFRTEAAKTLCEMVASERGTLAGRWREALAAISDAEREGGDAWVAEMTLVEEERAGGGGLLRLLRLLLLLGDSKSIGRSPGRAPARSIRFRRSSDPPRRRRRRRRRAFRRGVGVVARGRGRASGNLRGERGPRLARVSPLRGCAPRDRGVGARARAPPPGRELDRRSVRGRRQRVGGAPEGGLGQGVPDARGGARGGGDARVGRRRRRRRRRPRRVGERRPGRG